MVPTRLHLCGLQLKGVIIQPQAYALPDRALGGMRGGIGEFSGGPDTSAPLVSAVIRRLTQRHCKTMESACPR